VRGMRSEGRGEDRDTGKRGGIRDLKGTLSPVGRGQGEGFYL